MSRWLFLLAGVTVLLYTALANTTGILTGRVVDESGGPVVGATVRLEGTRSGGLTKADGRFTIAGIRAGDYVIQIGGLGHVARTINARVSSGQTTDIGTITLAPALTSTEEIRISARPMIEREQTTTERTIKQDEVDRTNSAPVRRGQRDEIERATRTHIVDAVALQGGVDDRGQNGISLRGGRTTETQVRVDGIEVSDPFAGGAGNTSAAIYPTVSATAVQEVKVVPNAVSAEYGDAVSGVVNSVTRPHDALTSITNAGSTQSAPIFTQNITVTTPAAGDKLKLSADYTGAAVADTAGASVAANPGPETFAAEDYKKIYENQFLASHVSPISTFSIDVDRASYSNVRRFLNANVRPPADAVRIEELVNYFDYAYPDPDDEHPFRILTEMSDCPWDRTHRLVRIGLQGDRMQDEVLPPSNLTFLIDVSGSMSDANKLPLLKQGLGILIDQLRPEDNVAIVVYAGAAGAVLPMTSGRDKEQIRAALNRLQSGGGTAGAAGINLAYQIAKENFLEDGNNRVILATDGDFNVGVSSEQELVELIEAKRKDGIFLTVLGFGTGNYQDSKMEQLADKGNGNYAYVDNLDEAKKVFVSELGGTLHAIAKDVKIQVLFSPERVESYRLIGYENRMLATEDFDDDLKDAGELGAGHSVTALYEIVPRGAGSIDMDGWEGRKDTLDMPGDWKAGEMMRVRLRYKRPDSDVSTLIEGPVIDRGVMLERTSEDFRFAAAVAEFGLLLRDSRYKGTASYDDVLVLGGGAKGKDANGYREEFLSLVKKARGIPTSTASR